MDYDCGISTVQGFFFRFLITFHPGGRRESLAIPGKPSLVAVPFTTAPTSPDLPLDPSQFVPGPFFGMITGAQAYTGHEGLEQ